MRVQSFSPSSQVRAGTVANFVIWVWSTKGESTGVTVAVHIALAQFVDSPKFTVCPVANTATCNVGNLPTGQADELQVAIKVRPQAALGEQVALFATASAKGSLSFQGSAADTVVVSPVVNPTTPPPLTLPPTSLAPTSLAPIAGTGITPSNPSGLFPTVPGTPSNTPSSGLGLPPVKPHRVLHAANASATVPMDPRLIGGQVAGLAVLAGAVAIAIARLSLRTAKPQGDGEKQAPDKS